MGLSDRDYMNNEEIKSLRERFKNHEKELKQIRKTKNGDGKIAGWLVASILAVLLFVVWVWY
jgi:hypothetical protein